MNISSFLKFARLVGQVKNPLPLLCDRQGLQRRPYTVRFWNGLEIAMRPQRGDLTAFRETWLQRDYLGPGIGLAAGDVVIDVGANIGCFTLFASRRVGPTGRVIAVEPDAETFDRLQHNLRINRVGNVVARRAALAGAAGVVALRSCANSLFSSIYGEIDGHQNDGAVQEVPAVTIDQIMDEAGVARCRLLKMDCEGAEHEVFHAMSSETAARIEQIGMELHAVAGVDSEVTIRRLRELGFDVHRRGALLHLSRFGR
jgi:FkbM family methyltransferase